MTIVFKLPLICSCNTSVFPRNYLLLLQWFIFMIYLCCNESLWETVAKILRWMSQKREHGSSIDFGRAMWTWRLISTPRPAWTSECQAWTREENKVVGRGQWRVQVAQHDKCLPANSVYELNNAELYLATRSLRTRAAAKRNGEYKNNNLDSALLLTRQFDFFFFFLL